LDRLDPLDLQQQAPQDRLVPLVLLDRLVQQDQPVRHQPYLDQLVRQDPLDLPAQDPLDPLVLQVRKDQLVLLTDPLDRPVPPARQVQVEQDRPVLLDLRLFSTFRTDQPALLDQPFLMENCG
jgi:hypothetical protein